MPSVELLPKDTYLAAIKNSVGSNLFRNLYADVDGERQDITVDGLRSCALFVSAILHMFYLVDELHANVYSTIQDMERNGWYAVKEPQPGSVLVWEEADWGTPGEASQHIGFYVGGQEAISNWYKDGQPARHHWTFNGKRKVERILDHKLLTNAS